MANFWFTKLSSARKMSNMILFGAEMGLTVLDSNAEIKEAARSCE